MQMNNNDLVNDLKDLTKRVKRIAKKHGNIYVSAFFMPESSGVGGTSRASSNYNGEHYAVSKIDEGEFNVDIEEE